MDFHEPCFSSSVTFYYDVFSFIYCLGYPWAHTNGEDFALLPLNSLLLSVWSILMPFLFFTSPLFGRLFFFSLHPSTITNPPTKNHLYTLSFLCSMLFFIYLFFFPNGTGEAVCCAGYQNSIPWVLWNHLTSPCVISRMYFLSLNYETRQKFG